jgi:DNA-directed RNA polymerase specialized sigma24 family protein
VLDHKDPSSARAIEALGEGDTRKNLLKFGVWLTGSEASAEDLLADALELACNPDDGRPWDPERGSFSTHMRIVMRDLAKRERRSSRARHEVLSSKKVARARSRAPIADEALADASRVHRLQGMGEKLRERLSTRPRALQVFDARMAGTEGGDELAVLLGCRVEEIYEANRQIVYHAAQVLAEERAAEDLEMKERRQRATKDEWS